MTRPSCSIEWRLVCRTVGVMIVFFHVLAFFLELLEQAERPHPNGNARLARHLALPLKASWPPAAFDPGRQKQLANSTELSAACQRRKRKDPECPVEPAELVLRPGATALAKADDAVCSMCGAGKHGLSCCRRGGSWFGLCGKGGPHTFRDGFRACNELRCERCAKVRAGNGDIDINCCHAGGSWAGRCGPSAQGWAFTWKDGFRVCNNMSLTPEPVPKHEGPFVPLGQPHVQSERLAGDARRPKPLLAHPNRTGLRIYYISLRPLREARQKLALLLGRRVPAARQTVVQGVPAHEALRAAGVPPDAAAAIFGEQAGEPEFLAALGCTMSHLHAAQRALAENANPALVLEEDVVLDLEPFWAVAHLDLLVDALPAQWQAIQLAMLATPSEWSELRIGWQRAVRTWGMPLQLKADFFWSTAAYLLHPRGMLSLSRKYFPRLHLASSTSSLPSTTHARWQLGSADVRCVKADTCVIYPALSAPSVYVSVPPMFTCAERVRSTIDGHDEGQQRDVHLMSRMRSLDLAAEAYRERLQRSTSPGPCGQQAVNPPNFEADASGEAPRFVLRGPAGSIAVLELQDTGILAQFYRTTGFTQAGSWHAAGSALHMAWSNGTVKSFCQQPSRAGQVIFSSLALNGTDLASEDSVLTLEPLAPTAIRKRTTPAPSLSFRFWLHDHPTMDWQSLLPCLPDWDRGMDSQNSAEVWLLQQLQSHPSRTARWQDAQVVVLPLLLKTSLQAAACLNGSHQGRLRKSIVAMHAHAAYHRNLGHDHVILFNYWDAWKAIGPRGSTAHRAFANVSFGWHETYDAAWGMANHRHVGKCQVALPYVEPPQCAALSEQALLQSTRSVPLFFAGAGSDFDTEGRTACPNVFNHSIRIRRALFGLEGTVSGAVLRRVPHNMRHCNGSATCEADFKRSTAEDMALSRFCAIATGDTPTTGRLFDAISCLCVPLIIADDLQLPFPTTRPVATPSFGLRLPEADFLAAPAISMGRVLARTDWAELQEQLLSARRALSYRSPNSRVAALALREAWASCLRQERSHARPVTEVAKC